MCIKKAADSMKKLIKKVIKTQKNLVLFKMMRLAIYNMQAKIEIKSFWAIFFDFITDIKSENEFITTLAITLISFTTFLK